MCDAPWCSAAIQTKWNYPSCIIHWLLHARSQWPQTRQWVIIPWVATKQSSELNATTQFTGKHIFPLNAPFYCIHHGGMNKKHLWDISYSSINTENMTEMVHQQLPNPVSVEIIYQTEQQNQLPAIDVYFIEYTIKSNSTRSAYFGKWCPKTCTFRSHKQISLL